jgi:hypothetical protein
MNVPSEAPATTAATPFSELASNEARQGLNNNTGLLVKFLEHFSLLRYLPLVQTPCSKLVKIIRVSLRLELVAQN